jgi:glycosyltransferase involved in cell wall biosynthesis
MTHSDKDYPLVVACLAAWNGESFIADTLASLAAQTYPNLKVLISDDASTDNTAAICERFATGDFRFLLFRQPQRLGWVSNVNTLLYAVQSDYFFFVPHDDVLEPTYVMRLVEKLEKQPNAVLAFSDMEFIDLRGDHEIQAYTDLDGIEHRIRRGHRMLQRRGPWGIPYRGIFRAAALEHIGGLRTNLAGEFAADWPWLFHMSLLGEFVRVPEVLYRKIQREESVSQMWKHAARRYWQRGPWWNPLAATLACANEIYRSRLFLIEKMLLHISLASTFLRWTWHRSWIRLKRIMLRRR